MNQIKNMVVPTAIQETANGQRGLDIYSHMLENRIIMLDGEINDNMASIIVAELLYLESKDPDADVYIYINSPGGSVTAGLSIIDTMNMIKPDVVTIGMGMSASMGSMILSQGAKGKRFITVNGEVMIHQPMGGAQGQATDILISAAHIAKTRERLTKMLADACSKDYDEVFQDMERDRWLDSEEAVAYGIVDEIHVKN